MTATMTRTDVPGAGTDDAPVYAITIQPDGTTTTHADSGDAVALGLWGSDVEVCSSHRFPGFALDDGLYPILFVCGSGTKQALPVNGPAWLLYGRSPLVGPAVYAMDPDHNDQPVAIPAHVVAAICGDVHDLWALLSSGTSHTLRSAVSTLAQRSVEQSANVTGLADWISGKVMR